MRDSGPRTVLLSEYRPYPFEIRQVSLTFRLACSATRVISSIVFDRTGREVKDLVLDGEGLKLISARIDGRKLGHNVFAGARNQIVVPASELPDAPFTWDCEVEIDPSANTELEGLYISSGMYCTQCEAEGFRKITYFPDRPDVMAPFKVRIESDVPVLLSNGNLVGEGDGWAEWEDPHPKPSYLFALVAGDLKARRGAFRTKSGRDVALNVWIAPDEDERRCDHALHALQLAMKWDEDVYGCEYDLDVFSIVAVEDFNMGAMENKGLNVFNSKYVLATPETATDRDYELIEGIIAHEYFHNWTGNRITCRDWFQLCLKEGLTVHREHQFMSALRSSSVRRIEEVILLRARQFREDNGPLAHPVRPDEYIEINNFYTSTVYEKGAEIVRMLELIVGEEAYRAAMALYLARFDGRAVTIEDFLAVFEEVTGRDLKQFKLWYTQAGTPRLDMWESWKDGVLTLHCEQITPPTPGQPAKSPVFIPLAVGFLNAEGSEVLPTTILEVTQAYQEFQFDQFEERPVVSVLRNFSAPVLMKRHSTPEERAFRLAHDTDLFARWDAGRVLSKDVLVDMVVDDAEPRLIYLDAVRKMVTEESLDPAFRALTLLLPSEDDIAQAVFDLGEVPEPRNIYYLRRRLRTAVANHLEDTLETIFQQMKVDAPYSPDPKAAGRRALRLAVLELLTRIDDGARARQLFEQADNMTEQFGALTTLMEIGKGQHELQLFYDHWSHDRLVIDKWFALQATHAPPDLAVGTVEGLTHHADFEWRNPNRFRALLGAFASNAAGFHHDSGDGYRLLADWLLKLDPVNPQTTARMLSAFETWRRYNPDRQSKMTAALKKILASENLSSDSFEMVTRILSH